MIYVTKADGTKQPFSEEKFIHSMERAHIPEEFRQQALDHVKSNLFDGITTREIYHHMSEFLGGHAPHAATLYSLKQSIMELGPTGYPFEDFISQLLQAEGYSTQVRQIIQGQCISHEIDVVAQKNTVIPTKVMVEAKYHNEPGIMTDVHVPMYTKSRFDDIKEKNEFTTCMIVTNTKMTSDAIAFGECVGIQLLAWSYPQGAGLADLVEKYNLVPITALSVLPINARETLLSKGIVLCRQICENPSVLDDLHLPEETKQTIISHAAYTCRNKEEATPQAS